ncbi:uncharacterized protein TRUGW13939_06637 [Talaromyces rugulosus]|uniref:NmrA-like domain-containing protein n=1 Tax=Talaromyces rugulosus TaxID=121627 RepID=A0A7H8R3P2_TALRU|nr:uncharacterized protein TRUGW13939_06637 [Talaromyces rugulosus]QKX59503.1 hypothetical protein TRUGW13939_06637 [Talaromyces rugulosus]
MATLYAKDQPAGFKNNIEKVAIVGAGGQVGKFITEALLQKRHFKITALTRQESTSVVPEGVEIKKVDYNEPSTLVEALKGQDVLIVTLAVTVTDEAEKLNKAAAEAGVPWVLPNEFGSGSNNDAVNQDIKMGIQKQNIRKQIEELGTSSWIGIVSGFWYEYSLSVGSWSYGFDINNRTVTFFDDGTQQINTSTWPQVGRAVANLLSLKVLPENESDKRPYLSQYKNELVYFSSFKVNQQEMFESLLRVTGTKKDDWKISNESVKARFETGKSMLQSGDRRGFGLMLYSRFFFPDAPGINPSSSNADLGLPEENLDEWTGVAVQMAKENYFENVVVPRTTGRR